MTSWNEYYDDFLDNISLYREKLPMTERRYMRWAAEGLADAQRRAQVITDVKKLTTQDGTNFPLGNDVLRIIKVVDSTGTELLSQSIGQKQMVVEQSLTGYNENPHWFGLYKPGTTIGTFGGYEPRIYDRNGTVDTIRVYPPTDVNEQLTMDYVVEIHRFTSGSPQWAAWFPSEAAFQAQFQQAPPQQWRQLDMAWQMYCVMQYLLVTRNPDYQVYADRYQSAVQQAMLNQQQHFDSGASAYSMTPFGF